MSRATTSVKEGILVEFDGMDWSPTHTSTTEDELRQVPVKWRKEIEEGFPCTLLSESP